MVRNITKPTKGFPVGRQSRIPLVHLEELAAIWDADKRMPSAPSRRAWALARRLRPEQVNNWFYRRKGAAKKNGIVLPEDSYELPLGTLPALGTQSLPPSSSPIPGTPMTKSSDYICVKKEDPFYQEERAAAMLSDDSMFRGVTPAQFSSGFSDASGSLIGCNDGNYSDNRFGGSRFSTRSAGTRTPLTPTEPSCFFSTNYAPYVVQPRSYRNAETRNSENRAYTPSIPCSHPGQAISSSGIQPKSEPENPPCLSSYYSEKYAQLQTQTVPVSSPLVLPHSVFVPSVPATSTFFPVSQPLQGAKPPPLTGPAQPGIVHYEGRIQLLQSLNYAYDIDGERNCSPESHQPSEAAKATNATVKQSKPLRYPLCAGLSGPSGLDATCNLPYSNSDSSTEFVPPPPLPQILSPPPPPMSAVPPIQEPPRLYLPAEDVEEQKQEKCTTTRIMRDPNTYSWCLGGKRYSYDGFFLGVCECSETGTVDTQDAGVQLEFKRYMGCTGPW